VQDVAEPAVDIPATTSAVAILDHVSDEAVRRHVAIHLVGAGSIMATCALPVRHRLGR
jgi:hypothetical protein